MPRKPKPENIVIGKILRTYRERNGETQAELAEVLGRERATIGSYETGMIKMPYEVKETVSKRYGIPDAKLGMADEPEKTTAYEKAITLALYVVREVEDPEARKLAAEFIEARFASK